MGTSAELLQPAGDRARAALRMWGAAQRACLGAGIDMHACRQPAAVKCRAQCGATAADEWLCAPDRAAGDDVSCSEAPGSCAIMATRQCPF